MQVSHPNLLCALLIHELRVVIFIATVTSLFLGNKLLSAKNVRTIVKWLQIVALQKKLPLKMRLFFLLFLSWQTIYFLEFLTNFTPIIMEEGTKNNLAGQSHQA